MQYLFTIHNKKEYYSVKVFRDGEEVIARLTEQFGNNTFEGKARNSEPQFDLSKGIRIAVARAKKQYYYTQVEKYRKFSKDEVDRVNEYFGKIEYLDRKYELSRDIRKGCYSSRKARLIISSDKDRNFDEVLNTLEAVYTCPSTLLDRTEALDKIMEVYRRYREE